jgi:hypothetical protein
MRATEYYREMPDNYYVAGEKKIGLVSCFVKRVTYDLKAVYRLRFSCRLRSPTRIGEGAGAAKTACWPGDDRAGILPPKKEFPACGGGMRRIFEHVLDLNRPSQPRLPDHPCRCEF